MRFTSDRDVPHLELWRRFNRAVRASGDVGSARDVPVRAAEYEALRRAISIDQEADSRETQMRS
jgi:hypothetical protein